MKNIKEVNTVKEAMQHSVTHNYHSVKKAIADLKCSKRVYGADFKVNCASRIKWMLADLKQLRYASNELRKENTAQPIG